ncbi:MAG: winged helix-turn-helix domain-containing protein [Chloroflexi bacterium]|nr:winged helix-turn-helix domain-containing protein [Chloroflexota bacterium]
MCGSLRLDAGAHRLTHKGRQTAITATEAEILSELMKNQGRAVPGSDLIQIVWGQDFQGATDSLKVNLPRIILTEPGIGYVLVEP